MAKLVTYVRTGLPQEEKNWMLKIHPDREFIETDLFPGILFLDNSISTQETLRIRGREDLIRPLKEYE